MPRKASTKVEGEPTPRRASARIAAAPKPQPSPEKPSPKPLKRGASQKAKDELMKTAENDKIDHAPDSSTDVNGDSLSNEVSLNDSKGDEQHKTNETTKPASAGEPDKKKQKLDESESSLSAEVKNSTEASGGAENVTESKPDPVTSTSKEECKDVTKENESSSKSSSGGKACDEVQKDISTKPTDAPRKNDNVPDEADFEVVKPNEVPKPDDKEVLDAIKAQGDDGSLLVGYVQVSKDEVLSHDSEAVQQIANKITKDLESVKNNGTNETHTVNGNGTAEQTGVAAQPEKEHSKVIESTTGLTKADKSSDIEMSSNGTA